MSNNNRYNRIRIEDLLNENYSDETPPTEQSLAGSSSSARLSLAFRCPEPFCGRKFISQEALKAHQRRSHAAPTSYACDQCTSTFSTLPNLNKHVRTVHGKLKPFQCEQCNSSFSFKDGLKRHIQMVHDQVRPFKCPHCSLTFKTKAHVNKHALSLHPDKHKVVSAASSSTYRKNQK